MRTDYGVESAISSSTKSRLPDRLKITITLKTEAINTTVKLSENTPNAFSVRCWQVGSLDKCSFVKGSTEPKKLTVSVLLDESSHKLEISTYRRKRHDCVDRLDELLARLGKIMAVGNIEEKKAAGLLASWIKYYSDDLDSTVKSYKFLNLTEFPIDFLWAE